MTRQLLGLGLILLLLCGAAAVGMVSRGNVPVVSTERSGTTSGSGTSVMAYRSPTEVSNTTSNYRRVTLAAVDSFMSEAVAGITEVQEKSTKNHPAVDKLRTFKASLVKYETLSSGNSAVDRVWSRMIGKYESGADTMIRTYTLDLGISGLAFAEFEEAAALETEWRSLMSRLP
jgi:hypothetical protein